MKQRRKITNLVLALVAVIIGFYAQSRIRQPDQLNSSILLYGAAVALFVIALRQHPEERALIEPIAPREPLTRRQRYSALAVMAAAVLSSLGGLWLFRGERPPQLAWVLYLLGLVLFPLAFALLESRWQRPSWRAALAGWRRPRVEYLLLAALLVLAFLLRFYRIEQQPLGFWYDEADNGLWARLINENPSFRPVYVESTNLPSHFLMLIATSFRLFGESVAALRLITALFGTLTVWVTYLLVRDLFGLRMGLVGGFILAVSHWDVNFSRLGMHGISTPFFILLVLYFLYRGLRSRRYTDFALAGLGLGLGLCFYVPFRLYPFIIGFFLLHVIVTQRGFLRQAYPHLLILGIATFLAVGPVALYAVSYPKKFFARTQTTSVFRDKTREQAIKAVRDNTVKHVLMFNYRGDGNGRHNLPGEPMLDFATSVFFVLGLGYSIYRWKDPRYAVVVAGFVALLSAGILSLDFEAPQSLRAIGTLPLAYLLAFVALSRVWREFDLSFGQRRSAYAWVAVVPLLAFIGYSNVQVYFSKAAKDFSVWNAYSTPETLVARRMAEMGPNYDFRVISLFSQTPTLRFLAPGVGPYKRIETTDSMPIYDVGDKEIVIFLDAERRTLYDEIRRYYPAAQYEEIKPPFGGPTVVYVARLTPDHIRGIQGLTASYYPNEEWKGEPSQRRKDSQITFDWGKGTPLPLPFSVEWQGTLRAPRYGTYRLGLRAPGAATLYIDETPVLTESGEAQLPLAEGNHALRLRVVGAPGVLDLYWQPPGQSPQIIPANAIYTSPPVTNNGLLGRYYQNANWQGEPALTKIDPSLGLYFHVTLLQRPYTVEWSGKINIPSQGTYMFGLESIDDSWLVIDDRPVVETHIGNQYQQGSATLGAGLHDIRLRYTDKSNWSHINLYWTPPGKPRQIIPAEFLLPPQGSYPKQVEAARPTAGTTQAKALELSPVATWGAPGNGDGQFKEPRDVAVGRDGRVYVADTGNKRVQVLDKDGNYVAQWNQGDQPFAEPLALVVNAKGEVLVLDSEPGWIYRFSPDGEYLGKFGGPSAQLYHPRGMAIDAKDMVYVADTGGGRLVQFDPTGAKAAVYGSVGKNPGQFIEPTDVAVNSFGDLYVLDNANHRIQRLDVFSRYQSEWAIPNANSVNGPHLLLAPDDSLLVTAPELGQVQRYASDGTPLGEWGQGLLRMPVSLTLHENLLYVADTLNHRLQLFQIQGGS